VAGHDVYLRSVPSDANPHDVRLYDPDQPDSVADDGFVPSPFAAESWLPDEVAQPDHHASFEVILCGPLEDTAVVADEDYIQPVSFDDLAAEFETQEPGFWATAPPDQDDEFVQAIVLEAVEAETEPDYGFADSPLDQDDDAPLPAYAAVGEAETDADAAEAFGLGPLDDAPVVDEDWVSPVVFDATGDGEADAEGFALSPSEDEPAAPVVEDPTRGKSGWDPYYYKRRNKRRTKREDVREFLSDVLAAVDAPEPVQVQADAAKVAATRYLAASETDEAQALLREALREINAFYAMARAEAKRRAEEDEEDEILLLLS
jgi:hypothetical protein